MVLQQEGVQDIYSFQIGMNLQILNLMKALGRDGSSDGGFGVSCQFGMNKYLEHPSVEAHFGIFQINISIFLVT